MRTLCVLLVFIVAPQATAAELPAIGDGQPAWLVAYECFQQAGDRIVAGQYESARQLLLDTSAKLPDPYQRRAHSAARKLPLTGPGNDQLVHADDFKVQLNDPLGRKAASDPKFDNRSTHDLNWMAGVCSDIEAHNAALALYLRSLNRDESRNTAREIVDLLYWTHGHPDEAERIIERSGDKALRERWREELPVWRDRYQHVSDPLKRLKFWHGRAPLARLHELESLRPLISTHEEAIGLERQRVAVFAALRDFAARDAAMEDVFQLVDDHPATCGELLQQAADRARGADRDEVRRGYLQRIADEYPTSPQAGHVFATLGRDAIRGGDMPTAVRRYEQLFAWAALDRRHWKVSQVNGRLNVSLHDPAKQLSLAYESLGDMQQALHFAKLARDRHRYAPECVIVDMKNALQQIDERVIALEARIAERKAARFDDRRGDDTP